MNILEVQDRLKGLSQEQLVKEMQMPSGAAPQFLVLSEITRRKRMQDDLAAQQQKGPQRTVAEEAVAAAGVPQAGLPQMAAAMAPKTDMVGNTGAMPAPQALPSERPATPMADGGIVRLAGGGRPRGTVIRGIPYELLPSGEVVVAGTEQSADPSIASEVIAKLNPDFSGGGVFDPNRPAYAQTTGQELDETFGQLRNNIRDEEIMAMGANPTFANDEAMRRVGAFTPPEFGASQTVSQLPPRLPAGIAGFSPSGVPTMPTAPAQEVAPQVEPTAPYEPAFAPGEREAILTNMVARAVNASGDINSRGPGFRDKPAPRVYPGWGADTSMEPYETLKGWFSSTPPEGYDPAAPTEDELMSGIPAEGVRAAKEIRAAEGDEALAAAKESAEQAAALRDAEGITQSLGSPEEVLANARAVRSAGARPAAPSGGSATAGGGAGAMSKYEQELLDAITRSERRAEQDKWLALAQAGMALMSSTQPTLGGALGEAGAQGLEAFRGSRDRAEETRLGILKELEASKLARAQLAAGSSGGLTASQVLTNADEYIKLGNDMVAAAQLSGDADAALRGKQLIQFGMSMLGGAGNAGGTGYMRLSSAGTQ